MPEITGLQLIGAARALHPELPVLLTTGHVDQHAQREISSLPLVNVVTKPWLVTTLAQAVQAMLHPQLDQER